MLLPWRIQGSLSRRYHNFRFLLNTLTILWTCDSHSCHSCAVRAHLLVCCIPKVLNTKTRKVLYTWTHIVCQKSASCWTLVEKLPVMRLLKNFLCIMEPKGSLSYSQELSTGPPVLSHIIPFSLCLRLILIFYTHLCLDLHSGLFYSWLCHAF